MKQFRLIYKDTLSAFNKYARSYNSDVDKLSQRIRDYHYTLFYQLTNKLADKIKNYPQGNPYILRIKRTELAYIFDVAPQTISNRLKRLKSANIIDIKFHGNKASIEIIFNDKIVKLYDIFDAQNQPDFENLTSEKSDTYEQNSKSFAHIKANRITRTDNNITITERTLINSNTRTYKKENTRPNRKTRTPKASDILLQLTPDKQKIAKEMAKEIAAAEKISFDKALARVLKGVKIENKTQHSAGTPQKIRTTQPTETKVINCKEKQHDIVREIRNFYERKNLEKRRKEGRSVYVKMFIDYLIENLFQHVKHQMTETYYNKLVHYVDENYYTGCKAMKQMEYRYQSYKYRIDVAKELIKNYKDFDTAFFYPLAYLKIEKKGKKHFSFQNTEKFWQLKHQWEKLNGYNRKIQPDLRKRMNSIARSVELGTLSYDVAIEKLKNMTVDNAELIRQFQLRMRANVLLTNKN